jgi:hypothetical protein
MGAFLDGIPFRVNPKSVSWPYSVKLAPTKTMGGKVVQIYGVSMGDLVIEGVFGAGGSDEQKAFFDRLVTIIESQMPVSSTSVPRPVRFHWPERGWDFWCYVKKIEQQNASTAIRASNQDFNPGYRLTLFVQEDNGDLVRVARNSAQAAYIARLSAGLGWKPSADWNGPLTLADALEGDEVFDKLLQNREDDLAREALLPTIAEAIRDSL